MNVLEYSKCIEYKLSIKVFVTKVCTNQKIYKISFSRMYIPHVVKIIPTHKKFRQHFDS